jgi:hypothetical protein
MTTTRTTSFPRRLLAASAVAVLSLGAVACDDDDDDDIEIDNRPTTSRRASTMSETMSRKASTTWKRTSRPRRRTAESVLTSTRSPGSRSRRPGRSAA